MKKYSKATIWIAVIIIVHIVGIVGLSMSISKALFESITAINLLFSLAVVLYFEKNNLKTIAPFFLVAFSIGMLVEIIGVNTGLFFGDYSYSTILGPKLAKVPLMIGVNWFTLSFCSLSLLAFLRDNRLKVVTAAILMTLLDFLLEPFAIRHGLWSWAGHNPPFLNYLSWFIFSLVICFFGVRLLARFKSKLPSFYLIILAVFLILDYILD